MKSIACLAYAFGFSPVAGHTSSGGVFSVLPGVDADHSGITVGEMGKGRKTDRVQLDRKNPAEIINGRIVRVKAIIITPRTEPRKEWIEIAQRHRVGDAAEGKIVGFKEPHGAFVELTKGVRGFVHVSEFGGAEAMREELKEGEMLSFEILHLDPREERLALGMPGKKRKERNYGGQKRSRAPYYVLAKLAEEAKIEAALVRIDTRWFKNPDPGYESGFWRTIRGAVSVVVEGRVGSNGAIYDDIVIMRPGAEVYVSPEGADLFGSFVLKCNEGGELLSSPYVAPAKEHAAADEPRRKIPALMKPAPTTA